MFDREKFLAETMLRIKIQKMLQERKEEKLNYIRKERAKKDFRKYVRNILAEAKKSPVPYKSTGIAVLADTLKKINPIIHDDFITLTTDDDQRRSFRAHIINGFRNALAPLRAYDELPPGDTAAGFGDMDQELMATPETEPGQLEEAPEDEVVPAPDATDLDGDGVPDAQEKYIETDPDKEKEHAEKSEISPEEEEVNQFTVDGEDETGRNMALQTFKKISKTITDAYHLLSNEKDKEEFYEYGIINLKLYFDSWEEDLQAQPEELV